MTRLPEPDDVRLARSVMERHYKEPVRPVSHYCERLASYADGIDHAIQVKPADDPMGSSCGPFPTVEDACTVRDGLRLLNPWRFKSNLLGRLIYMDMPLRTTPCPIHKGRWSGCHYNAEDPGKPYCECCVGYDVTGWLPDPEEASVNASL